jgi:hypothetical protein
VKLVIEKTATRLVGLKPLAVYYELRNGPLAHVAYNFIGGRWIEIDVDLGVFNPM